MQKIRLKIFVIYYLYSNILLPVSGNAIDSLAGAIAGLFGTNRRQGGKGRTAEEDKEEEEVTDRRSRRLRQDHEL